MKYRIKVTNEFGVFFSNWDGGITLEEMENFLKELSSNGTYLKMNVADDVVFFPKDMIQRSVIRIETKE